MSHDHHHSDHSHGSDHSHTDLEKLAATIPHLLKHNEEHARDMQSRVERAQKEGAELVAAEFSAVVELSGKVSEHLRKAIELLAK